MPLEADRVKEKVVFKNRPEAIEKLVRRIAARGETHFIYEAGPCGYEVHRQITKMGHRCVVIAPSMTPRRPGDRIKTDKRDAEKLAIYYRAGALTEVRVPTREEEAARGLVRTREDAVEDRLRARHRLTKMLLRHGRAFREAKPWGTKHRNWLRTQRFEWDASQQSYEAYLRAVDEQEARLESLNEQVLELAEREPYRTAVRYLSCLKGIATLTSLTLLVETQDFRRFKTAREYMAFTGMVPSVHLSDGKGWLGRITKAGNGHVRRVLTEAGWTLRGRNIVGPQLAARRKGCPAPIVAIARKAQSRLHRKFQRMVSRNKPPQKTVIAVARELAGFVWAIGQHIPASSTAE